MSDRQTFEPINLDEDHQERSDEMVTLFILDGEEYKVPAEPPGNLALQILAIARDKGEVIASAYALEEMLGTEGFDALQNYPDLTGPQLDAVIELAGRHALGDLEEGVMGKANRAARRGGGRGSRS